MELRPSKKLSKSIKAMLFLSWPVFSCLFLSTSTRIIINGISELKLKNGLGFLIILFMSLMQNINNFLIIQINELPISNLGYYKSN